MRCMSIRPARENLIVGMLFQYMYTIRDRSTRADAATRLSIEPRTWRTTPSTRKARKHTSRLRLDAHRCLYLGQERQNERKRSLAVETVGRMEEEKIQVDEPCCPTRVWRNFSRATRLSCPLLFALFSASRAQSEQRCVGVLVFCSV